MHNDDKNTDDTEGGQRRSPADLFERLLGRDNPVIEQLDKNAKLLAQSALSKLDVVPRSEFDAQAAVLQRTRQRIEELENKLETLTQQLDALEQGRNSP